MGANEICWEVEKMRQFQVKWVSKQSSGTRVVTAENQTAVLMGVLSELSPDGIKAVECKVYIKPVLN